MAPTGDARGGRARQTAGHRFKEPAMPTITPTRTSSGLRHAFGRGDLALVAVIATVLAASVLIVAIGPIDALAAARPLRCA
jgi:hypothetical protein